MENDFIKEEKYARAKKKIQEIRGFYVHLVVTVLVIPFLIFINLRFVPNFHWFWFPIGGLLIGLLIHWFAVFGYSAIGLGKDWEDRKIRELMEEDNKYTN